MSSLRIGVMGLGLGQLHVNAYLAHPAITSVVVCDPDEGRRSAALVSDDRVVAAYADPEAMLAAGDLDAVSVATPDHMHRAHAELCFAAGTHVLLTKPMATNFPDANAIVAAGHRAGRQLMVGQECRFRSRFARLRDLIVAGAFGDIINIRIDSIWDKRDHFVRSPWYASAETNRSLMVGTGVHEVDLLRFLVGRPVETVQALGNALGPLAFPSDKTVAALFGFAGGCIGQVTASYEAQWPASGARAEQIRILGTRGTVVGDEYIADGAADWQRLPIDENEFATGVTRSVTAFADALAQGNPVPVTGEDALDTLILCLASDAACRQGGAVRVPHAELRS